MVKVLEQYSIARKIILRPVLCVKLHTYTEEKRQLLHALYNTEMDLFGAMYLRRLVKYFKFLSFHKMLLTSRILVVGASEPDAHFAFDVCETLSFAFGITHLLSLIVKFPVHSVSNIAMNDSVD